MFILKPLKELLSRLLSKVFRFLSGMKAGTLIPLGFLLVIIIGTVFLLLPISTVSGMKTDFMDALFTSASSVCITGLMVYETASHWTPFGKAVILMLVQLGGLGFMSVFTFTMIFFGKQITLKERIVIQESFHQNNLRGMVRFIKNVIYGTFIIEGIIALILALRFMAVPGVGFWRGLVYGIFHSISAFCNAGIDIIGSTSLNAYRSDPVINIVVPLAVILGGLGFAVWMDIIKVFFKERKDVRGHKFSRLSLHSKMVILYSLFLILFGAIFFFVSEYSNPATFGNMNATNKVYASFFQSISPRTAGFTTVPQENLNDSSLFMTIILMFIGGSPGGTAGGVKTTSIAVILLSVYSVIKGRDAIVAYNKSIPMYYLQKALAVVIINLFLIMFASMLLLFTEQEVMSKYGYHFMSLLFETTSATGTVGLSMGITSHMTAAGRIIIMCCMFLGRIGIMTVLVSFTMSRGSGRNTVHYPEEKLLIG